MNIYEWRTKYVIMLGSPIIEARLLTIDELTKPISDSGEVIKARGTIGYYNAMDRCPDEKRWEAIGVRKSNRTVWTVNRVKPEPPSYYCESPNGEALFTFIDEVNVAFERFIRKKLSRFVRRKHSQQSRVAP